MNFTTDGHSSNFPGRASPTLDFGVVSPQSDRVWLESMASVMQPKGANPPSIVQIVLLNELRAADTPRLLEVFLHTHLNGYTISKTGDAEIVQFLKNYADSVKELNETIYGQFGINANIPLEVDFTNYMDIPNNRGRGQLFPKRGELLGSIFASLPPTFQTGNIAKSAVIVELLASQVSDQQKIYIELPPSELIEKFIQVFQDVRAVAVKHDCYQLLNAAMAMVRLQKTMLDMTGEMPFKIAVITGDPEDVKVDGYTALTPAQRRQLYVLGRVEEDYIEGHIFYSPVEKTFMLFTTNDEMTPLVELVPQEQAQDQP